MSRLSDPERLAALERSGILQRDRDDRLVTLCMTATKLTEADQAHVNVLSAERQFHVASFPAPSVYAEKSSEAGCRLVIASEEPVLIPDTLAHPEVCDASWVTVGGVRAYLGVPVRVEGQVLGSFCVMKLEPHAWTSMDVLTMTSLAGMVERLLAG